MVALAIGHSAALLLIVGIVAAVGGGAFIAFSVSKPAPPPAVVSGQVEYFWDFGDGAQAAGFNPTHTYKKAGTYQIVLTARNGTNAVTQTFNVSVNEGQVFTPSVVEVSSSTLETNAQRCTGKGACNSNGVCNPDVGENANNCGDCCGIGQELPLSTLCTCPPGSKRIPGNVTAACGTFRCVPLS
ncbi:PKD domain-containing protein [Candidatus Micrarchaeota archaeon]|nr:PKD domain-containing protein [Candidatus Micrarchaeota archaeon]